MDRYVFAITWRRTGRIYWAHAWRAALVAVALGFVAGVLSRLLDSHVHVIRIGRVVFGSVALFSALTLFVGAWSMRRALQVRYTEFAVGVTPVDAAIAAGAPTNAPKTERLALSVFWAMGWRAWLVAFPVNLFAAYWLKGTPLPIPSPDPSTGVVLTIVQLAVGAAACTCTNTHASLSTTSWRNNRACSHCRSGTPRCGPGSNGSRWLRSAVTIQPTTS